MPSQKRAILFQVKSSKEKIPFICKVAKKQFDLKHRILFRTQNEKVSRYIDQLLWSHPVHSLLPHQIALTASEEIICISHLPQNPNGARVLFNTTNSPILDDCFSVIYDFESPEDSQKLKCYRENGFAIASF